MGKRLRGVICFQNSIGVECETEIGCLWLESNEEDFAGVLI